MTRASISSLVQTKAGTSLLWIHVILLYYVTLSWIATLIWICRGAFHHRQAQIQRAAERAASVAKDSQYHPHPHPQYCFQSLPELDDDPSNRGLRLRTVMVTNVPLHLRSEKELADYFEYHLSRLSVISAATPPSQHGFLRKVTEVVHNHAKRLLEHMEHLHHARLPGEDSEDTITRELGPGTSKAPVISCVVIARKMTELAHLLERREEILQRLEAAHVKLAQRVLHAVKQELDKREGRRMPRIRCLSLFKKRVNEEIPLDKAVVDEDVREQFVRTLQPFVEDFGLRPGCTTASEGSPQHLPLLC
jgi:hypothetical protein